MLSKLFFDALHTGLPQPPLPQQRLPALQPAPRVGREERIRRQRHGEQWQSTVTNKKRADSVQKVCGGIQIRILR